VEDLGRRPRSEDVVVRAQDRLRYARGGDDEVGDGTELEEHEAAATIMLGGEVTEGDVREVADEVQVADDWQRLPGGDDRRGFVCFLSSSPA